ncbi:hypothetical protein RSO01_72380 [Reyranella soli]|uniref:Transmembrane protein n=1 Tax=Reyranella soli TaxID=1230389 RepID=A0A512NMC2_9HYPH|nr:hypothetical protein RSO01_72380 [Reyranella soli]
MASVAVATTPGTSPLLTASFRTLSAAAFMAFLLIVVVDIIYLFSSPRHTGEGREGESLIGGLSEDEIMI